MTVLELLSNLIWREGIAQESQLSSGAGRMVIEALGMLLGEGGCFQDTVVDGYILGEICQKISDVAKGGDPTGRFLGAIASNIGNPESEALSFIQNLQ